MDTDILEPLRAIRGTLDRIAEDMREVKVRLGFLETQQKIQVHFLMVLATGTLFALGVALYLYDFFFLAPKRRNRPPAWPTPLPEAQA